MVAKYILMEAHGGDYLLTSRQPGRREKRREEERRGEERRGGEGRGGGQS
jgi:hypothetical protein